MKSINYGMIKKLLELLDTCEEGLEHIKKLLTEGRYEDSVEMVVDEFQAIAQIEKSARQIQESIPENLFGEEFKQVYSAMDSFTQAYELKKQEDKFSILETELFPAFRAWKNTLNKVLGKYVIQ